MKAKVLGVTCNEVVLAVLPQINTTEKTFLETIDSHTLLLKSCIMSSYFKSTISDCCVASILYTLWGLEILELLSG